VVESIPLYLHCPNSSLKYSATTVQDELIPQGDLHKYLLRKLDVAGTNGQFRTRSTSSAG